MSYPGLEELDVSGSVIWHGIIHRPFEDISGVIKLWGTKCQRVLAGQDDADKKVPRTHCHILIENPRVKKERFRRMLLDTCPTLGRGDHMIMEKTQETREPYLCSHLSRYCLKGKFDEYCFNQGFTAVQLDKIVTSWKVDEPEEKTKKEKDESHYALCEKIYETIINYEDTPANAMTCPTWSYDVNTGEKSIKDFRRASWIMNTELNKAKVRTSQNELERFYVTILRMDKSCAKHILNNMVDKVMRIN